jgi:hypothetical protein
VLNSNNKKENFISAINNSYITIKEALYEKMNKSLKRNSILRIEKILLTQFFNDSFKFQINGVIEKDFMHIGILPIVNIFRDSKSTYYAIFEPLAIECCLKWWGENKKKVTNFLMENTFSRLLDILQEDGLKTNIKGIIFEKLISAIFLQIEFQDKTIIELPFIKCFLENNKNLVEIPNWIKTIKFKCEMRTNQIEGFNDFEMLNKIIKEKKSIFYKASDLCGFDGILILFDENGNFYLIIISFKLYSGIISKENHILSIRQTNLEYIFAIKNKNVINDKNKDKEKYLTFNQTEELIKKYFIKEDNKERNDVFNLLSKNQGILRLHIELPCTSFDNEIEKFYVNNNEINILLTKENLKNLIFDEKMVALIQEIWKENLKIKVLYEV